MIRTRSLIILILVFAFILFAYLRFANNDASNNQATTETISISGAFALYPLAVKWGEEFKKLHPNVRFDISAGGAGKGISDALVGMVDLGAVSREIYAEEIDKGAFPIAVARDAVVAIVNTNNPNIRELLAKGLSKDDLRSIYIANAFKNWKHLGLSVAAPIRAYTRSDAAGTAESWANYLGSKQEDLQGIGVFGDPGLLSVVKKDKLGIGYNNIAFVYNHETKMQLPGIAVLPIDLNNDGKVDSTENIYNTLDEFIDAVAADKYPSPPARKLYFVSKNKPQKKIIVEFLKWVLTEGQKFVGESGYIALPKDKLEESEKSL